MKKADSGRPHRGGIRTVGRNVTGATRGQEEVTSAETVELRFLPGQAETTSWAEIMSNGKIVTTPSDVHDLGPAANPRARRARVSLRPASSAATHQHGDQDVVCVRARA